MFRTLFDNAHIVAGVNFNDFPFKDLRTQASTDKKESQRIAAEKNQLGYKNESMTVRYMRYRLGKKSTPTK
ncbi:hypothetical protein [Neisseria sp. Ec49-e6-T10]|uniref:hypothetical protein n=1 Tax=Neisseria sp. Ec49-e6-T10 TaxID=3140744 RepID=UPI003EB97256